MHTIKHFFEGLYYLFLLKTGLIPEELQKKINNRSIICNNCPLKDGMYCTKYKAVKIKDSNYFEHLPGLIFISGDTPQFEGYISHKGAIYKKGCGCILILKQLSSDHCPLKKW